MTIENEDYANSLEIAGDMYQQSPIVKSHPHLPKDTKTSYLDKWEKNIYHYKSSAYQTLDYITKILKISAIEVENTNNLKRDIYKCKDSTEFNEYFKKLNKNYMWKCIKYMPKEEKKVIIEQIKEQLDEARLSGIVADIYENNTNYKNSFKEFSKENEQEKYKDDIGLINSMMSISELSKAFKGRFAHNLVTSINVTKDVRPEEEAEEDPEESENQRGFMGFNKKK